MKPHLHYLKEAYKVAKHSPDPSTQCGAILVRDGLIVIRACNHPPIGIRVDERLNDRDTKLKIIGHAERNAIYSAANLGIKTSDCVMYAPWFSCVECAKAIIQSGIRHIYGHKFMFDKTPERWRQSIQDGFDLFNEAKVSYEYLDMKVGFEPLRFNGLLVSET